MNELESGTDNTLIHLDRAFDLHIQTWALHKKAKANNASAGRTQIT
jgi:hypothetical protein